MEQLLHSGSGGGNAGGGTVAYDAGGHWPKFFQALNAARVVFEVGTHSPWVQEVIGGCGHEVLVANPRLMDGSKRRKRKNDRIDAAQVARLGRVVSESLYPIQHRSREVRQDLVMLRARDALVAADRDYQHHARFGQEHGHAAAQVFPQELRPQGRGGSCGGDAGSAAALGAFGSNPQC